MATLFWDELGAQFIQFNRIFGRAMPETLPQAKRGCSLLCIIAPTCGLVLALKHNCQNVDRPVRLRADLLRQNREPSGIVRWWAMGNARAVRAVAEGVFSVSMACATIVSLATQVRVNWRMAQVQLPRLSCGPCPSALSWFWPGAGSIAKQVGFSH